MTETKQNRTISELTADEQEKIRRALVNFLKQWKFLATRDTNKMHNPLAIRYVLGDMYRHDFLRSELQLDTENDEKKAKVGGMAVPIEVYRLFITTDKFEEYVKEGKEDLIK